MRILGADFTSTPGPKKSITIADCTMTATSLEVTSLQQFVNFQSFALLLNSAGPWVLAIDFPFGQPEQIIDDLSWPKKWDDYVSWVANMGKKAFRQKIDKYRQSQPKGKKEHRRKVDIAAGSISPMKMYGTPVGIMFCEGTPFLLASGASILPFLPNRDKSRLVIEGYPKLVATKIIGKATYKTDNKDKVTPGQRRMRRTMVSSVRETSAASIIKEQYGLRVSCTDEIAKKCVDDTSGDLLDSILCAIQAGWAWSKRRQNYGIPQTASLLEGWIVDPSLI